MGPALFKGLDISGSALTAELTRSQIVATNLANAFTTRGADGQPYRRQTVVFEEELSDAQRAFGRRADEPQSAGGVRVAEVARDVDTPFVTVRDPGHPDADANGYVSLPNVDTFQEMVDLAASRRSFQSNLAAMRTYRSMIEDTLQNFRR
ncbi:MAG: flagellar basal body rod protein FlgC [Planctomycetota bacterium]